MGTFALIAAGHCLALALCGLALLFQAGPAAAASLFNQAPVISQVSAAKKLASPAEKVPLRCVAVDRDRDALRYEWSAGGGRFEGSGPAVLWQAPDKPGVYTVTVKVSDAKGGAATGQAVVQVLSKADNPPLIEDLSARPRLIFEGKSTALVCEALDPDGDPLTYHWEAKAGRLVGEGAKVTWWAPMEEKEFVITCTVADTKGNRSRPASVTVKVICDCEGPGRREE